MPQIVLKLIDLHTGPPLIVGRFEIEWAFDPLEVGQVFVRLDIHGIFRRTGRGG